MPEMDTMERLETTIQRGESTKASQESHTTSKTDHTFLTVFPGEVRDMIYDLVLGDHTIHIKSDVISQKSDSEDDKHNDEDDGYSDDENDGYDDEEDEERPAELSEVLSNDRGPLYHSICKEELLHPKDARLYRIRSLEASGSRDSRVQSKVVVKDFKHVKCPRLFDPNLKYETIGSLGEEDKPLVQVKLAFLRVNKQVYQEASTRLYSTRTFGFDDAATFARFFSINYNYIGDPPTSTNGTNLVATKRNSIRSVHFRAKTALSVRQKIRWMAALDGAIFVLPRLEKIRVVFDFCHEGKGNYVDRTLWQYSRHCNGFPLLKTAEVRVASRLLPFPMEDNTKGEHSYELRDVRWRVQLLEAILGHHMDVLFGASLLDPASVAEREAAFDSE